MQSGAAQLGAAAGTFLSTEDQADGNYSHAGAFGSGALKGASMGAALGPWGIAAGAAIGGVAGLVNRDKVQAEMDATAEAERKMEERRERELELVKQQANDAVLAQFPVKGVSTPRYAMGGDTDPTKKQKHSIFDLPLNAKRLGMHDDILPGLTKLNEDELQVMIGKAIEMDTMFKGKSNKEKLAAFKNMDMSWVKPLREKTGLSKNQIIDAAGDSGALKQWAVGPVKLASKFMDFKYGGPTGPEATANPNLAPKTTSEQLYGFEDGPVSMRPDMLFNAVAGAKGAQAVYNAGKLGLGQMLKKGMSVQEMRRRAMGQVLGKEAGMQAAESSIFAMGGSTIPQYRAEGGEMIQHQANDVPKTDNNGGLNRMTSTEAEITGDKHSAKSGGVGMSDDKGARIYSDQLTVDKDLVAKLMKL